MMATNLPIFSANQRSLKEHRAPATLHNRALREVALKDHTLIFMGIPGCGL